MRALAVALAALAAGCVQGNHDAGLVEVASDDCYGCHRADYEGATDPVHVGERPTTCAECHSTVAWRPALEGGDHPEAAFPIEAGAHAEIACTDCHAPELGSSVGGLNVSCIGCHTGEHARPEMDDKHHEVDDYRWDEGRPAFCRDCHPRGRN